MQRKFIFLSIFLLNTLAFAEIENKYNLCKEKPIFISLGSRCIPALILRQYHLRSAAYPFDWMLSETFDNFYKIIETNFENFLCKESLIIDKTQPFIVRDQNTGFGYSHDFPVADQKIRNIAPNFLDAYEKVKEKYDRRIKRFLETVTSGKKIIFVRFEMGNGFEHALKIRNLLVTKYPMLNFYCIELSLSPTYKNAWNIPGIKNFYIDQKSYDPLDWNAPCWNIILKGIEDISNCSIDELIMPQQKDGATT